MTCDITTTATNGATITKLSPGGEKDGGDNGDTHSIECVALVVLVAGLCVGGKKSVDDRPSPCDKSTSTIGDSP